MNMEYLLQRKYQYERLIRNLNSCYNKLDSCYNNLVLCRKKIKNLLKIDGKYYSQEEFESIVSKIYNDRNMIRDTILPNARYEYNKILSDISNYG